jgi:hypothetical protein
LADVVQLALQPLWQLSLQFVVQSTEPGFAVHVVVQSFTQLDVQLVSAVAVHWASHCRSSFAAQHCTKLVGVHWVVHALAVTSSHFAVALTSTLPHAAMPAWATRGATVRAAKPSARMDTGRANERIEWFMASA